MTCLVPTATGMGKGIMDATEWVRRFLVQSAFHDYDSQPFGPKRKVTARYFSNQQIATVTVSMYRAEGRGDPRIWIYGLKRYASPGNLLVFFVSDGTLNVVNASTTDLATITKDEAGELNDAIRKAAIDKNSVAIELLGKLRELGKEGPIPTVTPGDTGVGMTLEDYLGIEPNSSPNADYKGIELKTSRKAIKTKDRTRVSRTMKNLISKVPDWNLSRLKSTKEIWKTFGYLNEEGDFVLHCTVEANKPNTKTLYLEVDFEKDLLHELSSSKKHPKDVATWRFETLRERLLKKHRETFWIEASSQMLSGVEHFQYTKALHTRSPNIELFPALIDDGTVTLDHLIRADGTDHGPTFRMWQSDFDSLFVTEDLYDLLA